MALVELNAASFIKFGGKRVDRSRLFSGGVMMT